jgi:hypothetical protein
VLAVSFSKGRALLSVGDTGHPVSLTASSPPSGILRSAIPRSGWENNTDVGHSLLFAQDHAQEAIVNRQGFWARIRNLPSSQ